MRIGSIKVILTELVGRCLNTWRDVLLRRQLVGAAACVDNDAECEAWRYAMQKSQWSDAD